MRLCIHDLIREEESNHGEWQEQPDFSEPPLLLDGAADHWSYREDDDDYYSQPLCEAMPA